MRPEKRTTCAILSLLVIHTVSAQYYEYPQSWPSVQATMYGADGAVWNVLKYAPHEHHNDTDYLIDELWEESPTLSLSDTMTGSGGWYWKWNTK